MSPNEYSGRCLDMPQGTSCQQMNILIILSIRDNHILSYALGINAPNRRAGIIFNVKKSSVIFVFATSFVFSRPLPAAAVLKVILGSNVKKS